MSSLKDRKKKYKLHPFSLVNCHFDPESSHFLSLLTATFLLNGGRTNGDHTANMDLQDQNDNGPILKGVHFCL